MARFLAILLLIPVWTHAQLLDPGPEHYEAAVNGIAVSRASAQLLALEAEVAILEAAAPGTTRHGSRGAAPA